MNFDQIVDRRNSLSSKWDMMEDIYGVSPDDGLAMWVADMDFRSADCIQDAVKSMLARGVYGYLGDYRAYKNAICWWMENRHGWKIDPEWIFTTHGLCNAVGLCLNAFTQPGDGVVLFTPVYHAFARVVNAAGRQVTESPMANVNGCYEMDLEGAAASLKGNEKIAILCSPHNPGGRVWTKAELKAVAQFCEQHDLILISDEIHHDLVYSGVQHTPTAIAAPEITNRLVTLTAPSKTFNTAGTHTGNVIIEDTALRAKFATTMSGLAVSPNNFGTVMTTAAYSPEGAEWVDALVAYLEENRRIFDEGISKIPGLRPMPLEATYLSWVDFSDTGMSVAEFTNRVEKDAKIGVNHGGTFGSGGELFLRFNIGTQKARIVDAVERMQSAFADLQ